MSETVQQFIARWSASRAAEEAVYQQFFLEFCDLLGVEKPDPGVNASDAYRFQKPVLIQHEDGKETWNKIDFFRKDCFVIEAKQGSDAGDAVVGSARRGTETWNKMMRGAFAQAKKYATYLPGSRTPFVITCDIGHCFEVWTGFSGDYGDYGGRQTIAFKDLADAKWLDFFRRIFTDPQGLNPALHAARVTSQVAGRLADLARALEADGEDPGRTAQFLMRCIFTMFAEDVGLLPRDLFKNAIRDHWIPAPASFPDRVMELWQAMDLGLPFGFAGKLLRFNGGLFAKLHRPRALTAGQLQLLYDAAACDWSNVEPAIFGTLVERALDKDERHKLGAHFTPREYIERLVRPTVIDPLRAEWQVAQTEARQILDKGDAEPTDADRKKAIRVLKDFHARLCRTRVLDPACGSGNFLYVTLDLFMELEAEVLRELRDLGEGQGSLKVQGAMVNPGQFLGIEKNPRARQIADLVLWIGYLQRQRRQHEHETPIEPILQPYKNIVEGDAVLTWRREELRRDEHGKPIRVWDGKTFKKHPVTGLDVPDETKQITVTEYLDPRPAEWPAADYIVSNPPFLGGKFLRTVLGDGYAQALWQTYPLVGGSADFVMYWWHRAAELVRAGKVRRFGFITTNSITSVFDRRVVQAHLEAKRTPLAVAWAIPDHPWVDAGADVRIAMTVACRASELSTDATLGTVTWEATKRRDEVRARDTEVRFRRVTRIHSDLSAGTDASQAQPLKANLGLASPGVKLHGAGFIVSQERAQALGLGNVPGLEVHIRAYRNGKDVAASPREAFVIDLDGLGIDEVRERFPAVFQHVLEHVKPERDLNNEAYRRENWWLFGRRNTDLRGFLSGLKRYIATPVTSKHRFFVFLDAAILPDDALLNIGIEDAWVLGVLSSSVHCSWAGSVGSTLEDRSRYIKTRCFDPFPFPDASEGQKTKIRGLAEALDAHRKVVQAKHPDVTLTGMYNALVRIREAAVGGSPLTDEQKAFHDRALIGTLRSYHDDLDAAVADAYGWPADLPGDQVLEKLVALNALRAEEESRGIVRWLRPEFQAGQVAVPVGQQQALDVLIPASPAGVVQKPWPKTTYDQIKAVRNLLAATIGTMSSPEIAASFIGAPPALVRRHLEALDAMGFVVAYGEGKARRWHAATAAGAPVPAA